MLDYRRGYAATATATVTVTVTATSGDEANPGYLKSLFRFFGQRCGSGHWYGTH